jgi:hypothetical protein
MIDLDAIERRANAATPGPWYVHESDRPGDYWTVSADPSSPFYREVFDDGSGAGEYGEKCSIADRDFLVAARTDVPALIAEVRRLREAIHGMVGQCRFNCTPATYCGMCGIGYEVLNEP